MPYHRFRADLCLAATCALAVGCGENGGEERSDAPDAGDDGIRFPAMGSLSAPSGRGSFRFGAASAATQIEDQNTSTDWYAFTLPIAEGGLGTGTFVGEASRGYTKALEDVSLITQLHLDSYRFSMEWARIEPVRDIVDETALQHYSAFVDALVAAKVTPNVTIHHFSNPLWVADPNDATCANGPSDANLCGLGHPTGGPEIIVEMAEHARLLAQRYGDRVDEWATLNEPVNYLLAAYGIGSFPPGKSLLFSDLLNSFVPVVRDFIAAHAAMYKAIKEADTVDADGDGVAANVGLTLSVAKWEPARDNQPSTDPEDIAARDRLLSVFHYLFPDAVEHGAFDTDLDGTAEEQHPEWANTLDWVGLQYYFRAGVTGKNGIIPVVALTPCFSGVDAGSCLPAIDPTFCVPTMRYESYAPGFYDVMMDFTDRYPGLPLVVSETGIATEIGERRAENVVRILEQIARARDDGADIRGYYHWSLYDNFEWNEGFVPRFGLFRVDYGTYDRTPTLGADVLGDIARTRFLTVSQSMLYGGDGPMTPEGEPRTKCAGL